VKVSVCLCFRFHQKPKAVQTVKLTLDHRPKPTSAIYRSLIHRMNQTARISLHHIINVKEQHQEAKNKTDAPIPQRARLSSRPDAPRLSGASCRLSGPSRRLSGVSPRRLSSAGEGGSSDNPGYPQQENDRTRHFFQRKIKNQTLSKH